MNQVLPPPDDPRSGASGSTAAGEQTDGSAPHRVVADRDGDVTRFNPLRWRGPDGSDGEAGAGAAPGAGAGPGAAAARPSPADADGGATAVLAGRELFPRDEPDPDGVATGRPLPQRHPADADGGPTEQHDPDGSPTAVLTLAPHRHRSRRRDWSWVEQWRAEGEPPAWGPGIAVAGFVAAVVAVAVVVLTQGVADAPVLAVVINLVIAAGMAPALWLSRAIPVLRFLAGGAAVGLVVGWAWIIGTF